jgi:hypothetical protein
LNFAPRKNRRVTAPLRCLPLLPEKKGEDSFEMIRIAITPSSTKRRRLADPTGRGGAGPISNG